MSDSFIRIEYPVDEPLSRIWLVFFTGKVDAGWRTAPLKLLRAGFRHVSLAAWYDRTQRWVFVNPLVGGTVIEVHDEAAAGPRFQQLVDDASLILRVPSSTVPFPIPGPWCVGTVKRILGVRSCALSPWQLAKHLLANGAEKVEIPDGLAEAGRPAGGSCDGGDAEGGTGTR